MKSQKKRAVVGYLDFNRIQLKYFKILLTSLEFINIQDTDIVIFYDLTYNEQIKGLENIQIGYNEAR
ncbi:hypothetical protein, partial [Shewanella algae]|uniref:hypothetical protein n=1 Tax=Shewanella algae TaxID=38313 RepID=UPI00313DD583